MSSVPLQVSKLSFFFINNLQLHTARRLGQIEGRPGGRSRRGDDGGLRGHWWLDCCCGGVEVGSRLCDGESAGGGAVDEGRSRSGDGAGVGRAEPLGPAWADSVGNVDPLFRSPLWQPGGGSHPLAACPEAEETSLAEGGRRKRVLPRWLGGYELGR